MIAAANGFLGWWIVEHHAPFTWPGAVQVNNKENNNISTMLHQIISQIWKLRMHLTHFYSTQRSRLVYGFRGGLWFWYDGDMGGGILITATAQKKLRNTASPQEKSTKHRHHKSATRIFSAMIRSSTVKIILLYLNNFPQNKHITTLFIAHTSFLRRNLARRKRTKEKRRGLSFTPDPSLLLLSSLFLV